MQQTDITQDHVQGFRSIHRSQPPSTFSVPLNSLEVVHIGCYTDPDTNNDFIFWEDILQAFNEALSVRNRTKVLPFVRGKDYRVLEPRRIAAVPDTVLDVVIGGESTTVDIASIERTIQDMSLTTPLQSPASSVRRNPAYGDVLEAMQNYNHMDIPVSVAHLRGPQTIHNEQNDDSSDAPTEQDHQPKDVNRILLSPQDHDAAANIGLMQTMINANYGDIQAQAALGDRYKDGREVHQDHLAAMDWYSKAAGQGHPGAQYGLGLLYEQGQDGVPQDHAKAFEWFHKAALQDYADAQAKVSLAYTNGVGVTRDNIKAMEWSINAAGNGHAERQHYMGAAYEKGHGVPQSDSESFEWYLKSAEQGFAEAQERVASAFNDGRGVPEDGPRAIEWYTKAANQGLAVAQFALGRVFMLGLCGRSNNQSKAVDWFIKAAVQGHTEAQSALREFYYHRRRISDPIWGIEMQTQSKIKEWFIKAAKQGEVHAQFCMGEMYLDEGDVDKDNFKAFKWYLKAAKQGDESAQRLVAHMYEIGTGVTQSRENAIEWYLRLAERGNAPALREIRKMLKQ